MKNQKLTSAIALILTLPAYANSAPNSPLEEIVISSSRVAMPLREVATSLSVIDADEIKRLGFASLQDILRTAPSVAVTNNGGIGKVSSLRIRGEEGFRTKVLIDGIDVSDTTTPQTGPRMEHLLSSGIQRVEILRGPQGMMYGADAGGIISINTQAPRSGLGGDFSAEAGRYGTTQYSGNMGAGNDHIDGNVSITDHSTEGFNARTSDTNPADKDGYDNTTLHARGGWNITEQLRLELVARDVDSDNAYDGCFTNDTFEPSNLCADTYEQQALRGAASFRGEQFQHELAYNRSETERQFFTEGLPGFGTEGDLTRVTYLGSYAATSNVQLVYGVDYERQALNDGTFDTERDQSGYYLEYQGNVENQLFFTAGARYDDNEDFGSHDSYRISAAYLVPVASAGEVKLKAAWSTGFRAPSLYEIAYNGSFFASPPASDTVLQEERSEGYDLGIGWYGNTGALLEAVYFTQEVRDEIFFDLGSFSGYLQDTGNSDSDGVELIVELPLPLRLSVQGNYTYNDTETAAGGQRVYRPRHLANLGLQWRTASEQLMLGLQLRASRDAQEFDGSPVDDYHVVGLNARYRFTPQLELYGRVENLLDRSYEEIPDFRSTERAAYAGVRYTF
ncbi:MAG: TonB-dependent receptor [Haliea sp.]|jgi:vitamin B12 transporter|nr:TonB-dependent receptor [Haliea sp.]